MDLLGYEIYITQMTLPAEENPWTEVELGNTVYSFKRSVRKYKGFNITGYIQKDTLEETRDEAEGLNASLLEYPSGVLIDGFGTERDCYVTNWNIEPIAGINKYNVSMTFRLVE